MLELAKKDCNGCGACFNACPVRCIKMVADEYGFLYPQIDTTRCVECGACEMACPPMNPLMILSGAPTVKAAYYNHNGFRPHAATGSIFSLIANYVIDEGGTVFGAGFDAHMFLRHRSTIEERDSFSLVGAKAVQSNTLETMREARELLQEGKLVFYTGTPCQIEGFLAFLGREYENLITADIICPGVMSPQVLTYYADGLEKDYGGKLRSLRVYYKMANQGNDYVKIILKPERKFYMPKEKNDFMKIYEKGYAYRPSCYECKFRKNHHLADFTLGDLISGKEESFGDGNGVSLVQINTEIALKVWGILDTITKDGLKMLIQKDWDIEKERVVNKAMSEDKVEPENNEQFFEEMPKLRFRKLVSKFTGEEKKGFLARFFDV